MLSEEGAGVPDPKKPRRGDEGEDGDGTKNIGKGRGAKVTVPGKIGRGCQRATEIMANLAKFRAGGKTGGGEAGQGDSGAVAPGS